MKIEELVEKYKAGETTLEEEKVLFEQLNGQEHTLAPWASYVKNGKKELSKNMEDSIWTKITRRRRNIRLSVFATAASILLIALFYFGNNNNDKQMTYAEKQAKLEEAYAMFDDHTNIIYEDELIIIYTE